MSVTRLKMCVCVCVERGVGVVYKKSEDESDR